MVGWLRCLLVTGALLLMLTPPLAAQEFDAFARVQVSPREGVVRQPYRVTISVYTATWYTAPLQFSKLRIDNAFIIPFTRTLSSMSYIDRKPYATLTFHYKVFPYEAGILEIPSLEITATTPALGDSRGVPLALRTRAQQITVNELPRSSDADPPQLVATGLSYEESWSKPGADLRAGDVIERRIALKAEGTLPALIPPLDLEAPEGVSLYPGQAELKDRRGTDAMNGERIEHLSYLFEEEGEVEIPGQVLRWWNPEHRKTYERLIPARTFSIAPNPDLDMLVSLKDSLDALSQAAMPPDDTSELFPWKKALGLGSLAVLALWLLANGGIRLRGYLLRRRQNYLASEAYYFRRALASLRKGQMQAFVNDLYAWIGQSGAGVPELPSGCLDAGERRLLEQVLEDQWGYGAAGREIPAKAMKRILGKLRREVHAQQMP